MPTEVPRTTGLGDGITAIDTDLIRPLFDASHLILEGGRAAFVDTGVNSSVPLLLATLARENIDVAAVDYVFLTHVHLDHAGGAGLVMQSLPNARAVLHPYGAPHSEQQFSTLAFSASAIRYSMGDEHNTRKPITSVRLPGRVKLRDDTRK